MYGTWILSDVNKVIGRINNRKIIPKATMEFSVKLRKILFPQIFKAKCNP